MHVQHLPSILPTTRATESTVREPTQRLILLRATGPFVGLYLLALLVRGVAALALPINIPALPLNRPLVNDEPEYYVPAVCIAQGQGYCKIPQQSIDQVLRPTAYRMPGPSLILALAFVMLGPSIELARWLSIVIGSLSAPMMYLFARKFIPGRAALFSGLACALWPTHIYNCFYVQSESYFIPAMLLSLLLTLGALGSRSLWPSLIAGAAWGMTTLIRPHGLPMSGLIALYMFWHLDWRHAGALVLGVSCMLAPWVVRNWITFDRPVLLATEGGETLLGANNPYVMDDPALRGMWISPLSIAEYRDHLRSIQNDFKRDEEQRKMALTYLRENTDKVPTLVFYKLWRWLTPVTESSGVFRVGVLLSYGLLLVSLFVGLFLRVFRSTPALHLALMWTCILLALTCVYWGGLTRGRLPLEIIWLPWGVGAAFALFGLLLRRRSTAGLE
jgi:hypothetical protein